MEILKSGPGGSAQDKAQAGVGRPPSIAHLGGSALVLLAFIFLIINERPPPEIPRSPDEIRERLLERQNYVCYFEAITIAKSLLPGIPAIKWSHIELNPQSFSCPLKHDFWYAQGTADVPPGTQLAPHEPWQLVFIAKSKQPIFFRIGHFQCGDINAAAQAMNGN